MIENERLICPKGCPKPVPPVERRILRTVSVPAPCLCPHVSKGSVQIRSNAEPLVTCGLQTQIEGCPKPVPPCANDTKTQKKLSGRSLIPGQPQVGGNATYRTKAFGTGMSPFAPNWWMATPALERFRYQVPLDGLNTETSSFPSPS